MSLLKRHVKGTVKVEKAIEVSVRVLGSLKPSLPSLPVKKWIKQMYLGIINIEIHIITVISRATDTFYYRHNYYQRIITIFVSLKLNMISYWSASLVFAFYIIILINLSLENVKMHVKIEYKIVHNSLTHFFLFNQREKFFLFV